MSKKTDMFSLLIHEGALHVKVKLASEKEILYFPIEYIVGTRSRTEVMKEELFAVLNAFLDNKGDVFKSKLYKALTEGKLLVDESLFNPNITPLPTKSLETIFKLLDIDEIEAFILKTGIVQAPTMLKTVYSPDMERNDEGSREQTYLKSDYFKLIALINILRVAMCLVGEFGTYKKGSLPTTHKEYILVHFFLENQIVRSEAFLKLKSYIDKLLNIVNLNDQFAVKVIEKNIPKKEFSTYLLGLVIFQKFLLVNETIHINDRNIITKLYNFIASKIGLKNMRTPNGVTIKNYKASNVANLNEPDSSLEQFRAPTAITLGTVAEIQNTLKHEKFEDVVRLLHQVGGKDVDLLAKVYPHFRKLDDYEVPRPCLDLMSWVLMDVEDARGMEYPSVEYIVTGLVVAYVYLIENGYKDIALLLSTYIPEVEERRISLTLKSKLSKENKNALAEEYPNFKTVYSKGGISYSSFIEETITELSNGISVKSLKTILPRDILETHHNGVVGVEVPSEIRNLLAELILFLVKE